MPPFLRFKLDNLSFWVGFVAASLFWWLFLAVRALLPRLRASLSQRIQAARQSITASTESRLRSDVLRTTQRMHLAAPLFSLEDVLLEPRLMLPPPAIHLEGDASAGNIFTQILPYLPDWPEFSAAFNAPTFTLAEALHGKANLILMGQPGSGKTVALAHLAAVIARQDAEIGELADCVPLLIHAADISVTSLSTQPPLDILIQTVSSRSSTLTLPRLPRLIEDSLENGRALLLVDGLDELPPALVKQIATFITELLKSYPKTQAVVVTSTEYYAGLTHAGFIPVAIAAWSAIQRTDFIEKWSQAWVKAMIPQGQVVPDESHPFLLNQWILAQDSPLSPLEYTLKAWAVYAGDVLGPETIKGLEAYLRRMTVDIPNARPALEALARQLVTNLNPAPLQREAENWIFEYDQPVAAPTPEVASSTPQAAASDGKKAAPRPVGSRLVPALISNGLLVTRPEGRLTFVHPVLQGYLAGSALARQGSTANLETQPDWAGKSQALYYMAGFGDVTALVSNLMSTHTLDPLHRGLFTVARWLRVAPRNAPWRAGMMRQMANVIQKDAGFLGYSGRVLAALGTCGEAGLGTLFRQYLQAENENLRFLSTLGCGLVRDNRATADLAVSVTNEDAPLVAQAACIALAAIGDKPSQEAMLQGLFQNNDVIRNTTAEILAHDPKDGYETLKEATTMDDLVVRRAAVYGLSHVQQPWALQMLEKIAVEDGQWVVRDAAARVAQERKQGNPYVPQRLQPLHETPWLIAYAARLGMGVSPGKPAMDLLVQAAKDGEPQERQLALQYLRLTGDENTIVQLYNTLYGTQGSTREAAYDALWHMAAAGVNLPPPTQFGLG
jgi:HEAT repeat protein